MAAPASAAPMAASAISSAVIGRCGDIDGVWIDPVTAHVMMTLRPLAMCVSPLAGALEFGPHPRRDGARLRRCGPPVNLANRRVAGAARGLHERAACLRRCSGLGTT